MSRRTTHHGFTLLELILAMAMVSMLALSLYTSLQIGLKTRERAIDRAAPVRAGEEAMEMIRKDLEAALPPTGLMAVNSGGFYGESNQTSGSMFSRLGFVSVGDGPMHSNPTGQGGMRRVVFEVLPGQDGKAVLVRHIYSNLLTQIDIPPDDEVICRGVKVFDIQYYDASSMTWMTDWDSTQISNTLPMAVQVNLELEYPGKRGDGPTDYLASRTYMLPCYQDPTTVVNNTTSTALGGASSGSNRNTGNTGNRGGSTGGSGTGGSTGGSVGGSTGGTRGGGR